MKWITFIYNRSKGYIRQKIINRKGMWGYANTINRYAGHPVLSADDINKHIYDKIQSGNPFMLARFGSTELLNMWGYEFPAKGEAATRKHFAQLCDCSGFFPHDVKLVKEFVDIQKNSLPEIDVLGIWFHSFEDYYIRKLMSKDLHCTFLFNIEPWTAPKMPWTAALKGKKVLVIHPFTETIQSQYKKRNELFPGTNILPEFDLKTLKAVQTIAGQKDGRFNTWFEALEWMYQEAIKIDFDIAIIGCGAYGMPLAAKLKQSGKQVVHLGGATQLLFGIKGKRWEVRPDLYSYVQKYFNDAWVYPADSDKPKQANKVEGGCYW